MHKVQLNVHIHSNTLSSLYLKQNTFMHNKFGCFSSICHKPMTVSVGFKCVNKLPPTNPDMGSLLIQGRCYLSYYKTQKWQFSQCLKYLENTMMLYNKNMIYRTSSRMTTWGRHQMETFFALLAICTGNSTVTGEFPTQRPLTRSFDIFVDLPLNKRLSKKSWGWWFETQSRPLKRYCNDMVSRWWDTTRIICVPPSLCSKI